MSPIHNKRFVDLEIPDRVYVLTHEGTADNVYELLSKHLGSTIDELKKDYKIDLNKYRQRIFISSNNYSKLCELFQYLNQFGISYESITQTELRIDISMFCKKIV